MKQQNHIHSTSSLCSAAARQYPNVQNLYMPPTLIQCARILENSTSFGDEW